MRRGLDSWWRAEVVHAHDWHAGLAAAYLFNKGRPAKSVFTIHNLAYQGQFAHHHLHEIGLPEGMFHVNGLELFGQISYLKAGLYYSDMVTAVVNLCERNHHTRLCLWLTRLVNGFT